MRIAFLNRGRVHPGGDLVALDATMQALRKRGHICVETGWDVAAMKAGSFDLAHMFHCDFDWSDGNYKAIMEVGLPYVVTPIFYGLVGSYAPRTLDHATFLLPFSQREAKELLRVRVFSNVRPIPNGTDKSFRVPPLESHPITVLTVSARGKSDKNVDMVERVCNRLGYSFRCAVDIPREEMPSVYQSAEIFVNASDSERMSLTIAEALCAGCRVLATQHNWGNEWYPGLVTFDPADEIKFEHLLRLAKTANDSNWDWRPNIASSLLTWNWVAEKIEEVYKEVLNG